MSTTKAQRELIKLLHQQRLITNGIADSIYQANLKRRTPAERDFHLWRAADGRTKLRRVRVNIRLLMVKHPELNDK